MNAGVRRLAIVTSRFPFGSAEPYLNTELRELAKYFERIAVLPVRPGTGETQKMPETVELVDWPLYGKPLVQRALRALRVHPQGVAGGVANLLHSRDPGRLKNAAVMLKGIAFGDWLTEHGYDHVHAYWLSTPASVAYLAAQTAGISWSATAHRWDIYERNAFDVKGRTAAFVRAISARGAADVSERMPSIERRVLHVRLGADVTQQPAPVPRRPDVFRIVCAAALVEVKGHADLLTAIAQLRRWGVPVHCTIAGRGPLHAQLEQRASLLHVDDSVEFAGFVQPVQLLARYRAGMYDALVLASVSNGPAAMEGVPSAIIEAMAAGIPVVATDSGSVCELLDSTCGWIVPPSHPDALARALLEVYLNPGTARARARRAFEIVAERHDVRAQMAALAGALSGERMFV